MTDVSEIRIPVQCFLRILRARISAKKKFIYDVLASESFRDVISLSNFV
jgi:hypothetical protein